MKASLCVLFLAISIVIATAGETTMKTISWTELQAQGQLLAGTLDGDDLLLEQPESLPFTARILVLDKPPVTAARYALTGEISYEGVEGQGYLEMWNYFPGGGAYFSRTLGDSGPLGALKGDSNRRLFQLPFYNNAGGPPPDRLEFSLVLPGKGRVHIGPLKLIQIEGASGATGLPVRWLGLGALAVLVAVAAGVFIAFSGRQRRKMELRRLQSLDAGR